MAGRTPTPGRVQAPSSSLAPARPTCRPATSSSPKGLTSTLAAAEGTPSAAVLRRPGSMRTADTLCVGLLLAAAFTLGTTKLEDTDAWTHLAMGREIVELGTLPASEPFVFPSAGMPFYHMEGLFAVALYLSYAAAGFAGVILLKAELAGVLVLIVWKVSWVPRCAADALCTACTI